MLPLKRLPFLFFILALFSCKEAYKPETTSVNSNILVVEGFINTGADSTIIKLGRTVILAQKNSIKVESGATIFVESDANEKYLLKEEKPGRYASPNLNLNPSKKYRLNIKTAKGSNYLSSFVIAKISPPIDSLNWKAKADGIYIYANTHDVNNGSHYYRWDFIDTWKFSPKFFSSIKWNGKEIVDRNMYDDNIAICWANGTSNDIILESSAKLGKDVISQKPIAIVRPGSEKTMMKYSILVRQYVLTKEAYDFWENLRKNTESLGSIFDAQPSELTGNITSVTNPAEPVIGYISAGTTQEKRIFIDREEVPNWPTQYPSSCVVPDTIPVRQAGNYFSSGTLVPIAPYLVENVLVGYLVSSKLCGDCTIRGTSKQPSFWQ